MNRRTFVKIAALASAPVTVRPILARQPSPASEPPSFRIKAFEWEDATIAQLQAAMKSGQETAVSLAKKYLQRIEEIDQRGPTLKSIIEFNPTRSPSRVISTRNAKRKERAGRCTAFRS
jgi:amidase